MYKFVLLFLYSGLFTSTLFCVGDFFIEPCILTYFFYVVICFSDIFTAFVFLLIWICVDIQMLETI